MLTSLWTQIAQPAAACAQPCVFASASADGTAQLWSTSSWVCLRIFQIPGDSCPTPILSCKLTSRCSSHASSMMFPAGAVMRLIRHLCAQMQPHICTCRSVYLKLLSKGLGYLLSSPSRPATPSCSLEGAGLVCVFIVWPIVASVQEGQMFRCFVLCEVHIYRLTSSVTGLKLTCSDFEMSLML